MILLAYFLPLVFLPLAFYVLVLGIINRRPHPLMVSGPWDFTGILFAASGFLIFAGPFVISTLNQNARTFFLFGPGGSTSGGDALWLVCLLTSLLYFVLVLAGAIWMLGRQRSQTVIYNIDQETFEITVAEVCEQLAVRSSHTGTLFSFESGKDAGPDARRLLMDVDYFRPMRHVTLRWTTVTSPLRRELEDELSRKLEETVVMPSELGNWLTVLAFVLLGATFLVGFAITLYRVLHPI